MLKYVESKNRIRDEAMTNKWAFAPIKSVHDIGRPDSLAYW